MRTRFVLILIIVLWGFTDLTKAQGQPYKIMPLGDSITRGAVCYNSYRRPLWKMLQTAGIPVDFVGSLNTHYTVRCTVNTDFDIDHEGHEGWRADQILAQIPAWAATYMPDIVLMHVGTNDVVMHFQTPESTIEEIGQIIDALRAVNPNVKVLLAKVTPHNLTATYGNPPVNDLNALIPGLVASKTTLQSPVYLVDMTAGFDVNTHLYDGLHPNRQGEYLMAVRWFTVLKQVLSTDTGTYELVTNGGFEAGNHGWTRLNISKDNTVCNKPDKIVAYEGDCAYRFTASAAEISQLVQTAPVWAGTVFAGDEMVLSVYTRAVGTPLTTVTAIVHYENGLKTKRRISITAGEGYTLSTAEVLQLEATPRKVVFRILNRTLNGTVWVDRISMVTRPVIGRP